MSTREDVDAAVSSAERAFPGWSRTPIKERVQVFYKYKALLEKHIDELAALVTEENGKVTSEARAEVLKAAELLRVRVLAAADRAGRGARGESRRRVPHRAVPGRRRGGDHAVQLPEHGARTGRCLNAIALGNCMILKPSELVPLSAGRIAELLREAGLPDGVFQVVHGGRETVEAICDHSGHRGDQLRRLDEGREGRLPPRRRRISSACSR